MLLRLLDMLDPAREPGRITLIARMGHDRVAERLPPLLARRRRARAIRCSGPAIRCTATRSAPRAAPRPGRWRGSSPSSGLLRRGRAEGVRGGGIHLEMTGRDVTECTGGAARLTEADLADRYHTHCDPRLNPAQAMELAELVARSWRRSAA